MLTDVGEHLRLFRCVVNGQAAVGAGEVQPFRNQLINIGEILLE